MAHSVYRFFIESIFNALQHGKKTNITTEICFCSHLRVEEFSIICMHKCKDSSLRFVLQGTPRQIHSMYKCFLKKSKRLGYCDVDTPPIADLFATAEDTPLVPDHTSQHYNLRNWRHHLQLMRKTAHLNNKLFGTRMLFKDSYWSTTRTNLRYMTLF